jgi:hypothetical protein
MFRHWVAFVMGVRPRIVVALDWTARQNTMQRCRWPLRPLRLLGDASRSCHAAGLEDL